eukprot:264674_1
MNENTKINLYNLLFHDKKLQQEFLSCCCSNNRLKNDRLYPFCMFNLCCDLWLMESYLDIDQQKTDRQKIQIKTILLLVGKRINFAVYCISTEQQSLLFSERNGVHKYISSAPAKYGFDLNHQQNLMHKLFSKCFKYCIHNSNCNIINMTKYSQFMFLFNIT